jgi:CubicO group peptidase (beta-lactamase class C family)
MNTMTVWVRLIALLGLVTASACHAPSAPTAPTSSFTQGQTDFEGRVRSEARRLTIPGIAYAAVQDSNLLASGELTTGTGPGVSLTTARRFASVTKAFTAVLLMRAVEQRRLSLDDSVSKWIPEFRDTPAITVRHLAAHVSEGVPGTEYVYGTNRYARLGEILRQAYQAASYEAALRREIIEPAGLTWHDSPDLGAHAALISTVADVARFVGALQRNTLISGESLNVMATPYVSKTGSTLPVGVGVFTQQVGGQRVVWSFGQDDPDYGSALLLMIPERQLALVMLANTDELSDPFRLLMGNIRTSPFATAFLDSFAPDLARDISTRDRASQELLVAVATGDEGTAVSRFTAIAANDPPRSDDFALHFAAAQLTPQLPAAYCQSLDARITQAHPNNRWALLMSGSIQSTLGNLETTMQRYESLLKLPNQQQDGLARLFRAWSYLGLANALQKSHPERAREYVRQGLETGVTGDTRGELLSLDAQLGQERGEKALRTAPRAP